MNYYDEANVEEVVATSFGVSHTVSETELFAHFAELNIEQTTTFAGVVKLRVNGYRPVDCLIDPGTYGELEEFSETIYDRVLSSDEPESSLSYLIDDLEMYLRNLQRIRDDFATFKGGCLVEFDGGPEPQDPELLLAWEAAWEQYEEAPRFRVPEQINNLEVTR